MGCSKLGVSQIEIIIIIIIIIIFFFLRKKIEKLNLIAWIGIRFKNNFFKK